MLEGLLVNLAARFCAGGQPRAAERVSRLAERLNRHSERAATCHAVMLDGVQRTTGAIALLREKILQGVGGAPIRIELAELLIRQDFSPEVLKLLDEAEELDGDNHDLHVLRLMAAIEESRWDDADELLRKAPTSASIATIARLAGVALQMPDGRSKAEALLAPRIHDSASAGPRLMLAAVVADSDPEWSERLIDEALSFWSGSTERFNSERDFWRDYVGDLESD